MSVMLSTIFSRYSTIENASRASALPLILQKGGLCARMTLYARHIASTSPATPLHVHSPSLNKQARTGNSPLTPVKHYKPPTSPSLPPPPPPLLPLLPIIPLLNHQMMPLPPTNLTQPTPPPDPPDLDRSAAPRPALPMTLQRHGGNADVAAVVGVFDGFFAHG